MKSLHFVRSFAVLPLSVFVIVLAAGPNIAVHAGRLAAIPAAQMPFASLHVQTEFAAGPLAIVGQPQILGKATSFDSGGSSVGSVAVADLNGDGKPDLIVTSGGPYTVSVLLGNGDGTFQAPVGYTVAGSFEGDALSVVDVNGDGRPDIIVTFIESGDVGAVAVLLGNGNGTFQSPTVYGSGGYYPSFLAVGDLNGDGRPDLIVGNGCGDQDCDGGGSGAGLNILFGNGPGTFAPAVSYDLDTPSLVADLNGDGKLDLVFAGHAPYFVSVMLGNGDGTFQSPIPFTDPTGFVSAIAAADMNGDGKPDLVASIDCSGGCPNTAMNIFLGNGDGTFQPPIVYDMPNNVVFTPMVIADMNGDGKLDVVGGDYYEGAAYVLLGLGDGNLDYFQKGATGLRDTGALAVADLNADGRPDVITGNSCPKHGCAVTDHNLVVQLNKSFAPTTTTVTSSLNPAGVNQSITFTATTTSGNPVPDGAVITFLDGKVSMGTGTMTNGVATFTTSFAKAKTNSIKATYPGDDFRNSSRGVVSEVVTP